MPKGIATVAAWQIAIAVSVARPSVGRWQQCFAEARLDGLWRDKTCKPGRPPIAVETVARVLTLTCGVPLREVTQWTARAMDNDVLP